MALASIYFYDSNNPDRQTLHRRIRPSDSQFDDQQDRWNELKDFMLPRLRDASGYPLRSWLQGSYKFGTQIRPMSPEGEFDIDLGVYYCWKGDPESSDYDPKTLKSFVQDALKDFAAQNSDVKRVSVPSKPRCCRIHFEGDFHIDVPCYHLDIEADARALATESNEWEDSDPKALYKWFTSEFDTTARDRVRRLIRYMKTWAALKLQASPEPPSSVLITVLVANAYSAHGDDVPRSEDKAFAEIVTVISNRVSAGQEVRNPVDECENLAGRMSTDSWQSFVDALEDLRRIASDAMECNSETDACSAWSLAFEHMFPLPDQETLQEEAAHLPASRATPQIAVQAVSLDNSRLTYNGTNEIGPILKNCKITFRVTNAGSMPHGTEFFWVVRNEGDESEDMNDLGHRAGSGTIAVERSGYNGTHYMDCSAVVSGRIVGVRRVKVRVSGERATRRNPTRKPAYVSLRGRR